jgi:hypothetical protein
MAAKNIKIARMAALIGAALFALANAGIVLGEAEYDNPAFNNPIPEWAGASALALGLLLLFVALTGMHGVQKRQAGTIGRIGYLTTSVGLLVGGPMLWPTFVIGAPAIVVGSILFGIATLRARVFSPAAGWLLALGMPAAAASAPLLDLLGVHAGSALIAVSGVLALAFLIHGVSMREVAVPTA